MEKAHHSKNNNDSRPLRGILRNKDEKSPLAEFTSKNGTKLFNSKAKSVSQYAYEENKNSNYRNFMEDLYEIKDTFNKDQTKGYFSLFDGHGGVRVVEYIRDHLMQLFLQYLKESGNIQQSLTKSFEAMDKKLSQFEEIDNVGSTGTVVFITKETDLMIGTQKVLYCANVGDTRCVLLTTSGCKRLTFDHKCTDPSEAERIKKKGGNIVDDRVMGKLALTRAFGDYSMKRYGVISTPTVNKITLNDGDKFIVICSDGVWDVIDEEDMFYFMMNCNDCARDLAETIVKESIERGTTDNVSCIAIKI